MVVVNNKTKSIVRLSGKTDIILLENYINGEDIEHITEKENDFNFMMDVINYTNDKKMYHFASDEVKSNYEFVKFIINKFKNDLDFICDLADKYLKNEIEDINRIELILMMCDLTKNNNKYHTEYKTRALAFYSKVMISIETCKLKEIDNSQNLQKIEIGFYFIIDLFHSSDIVMKYFAEQFIISILLDKKNFDLESELHQEYSKFEELCEFGVNKYIINLLNLCDSNLAYYAIGHLEVLECVKEELNRIELNWDIYDKLENENKYNTLFEQIHTYMENNDLTCSFSELEILYYVGRELGVAEQIKKYDYLDDDSYNRLLSGINIEKQKMSFIDFVHYNTIKKIMKSILAGKLYDETFSGINNKGKRKSNFRILRFKTL